MEGGAGREQRRRRKVAITPTQTTRESMTMTPPAYQAERNRMRRGEAEDARGRRQGTEGRGRGARRKGIEGRLEQRRRRRSEAPESLVSHLSFSLPLLPTCQQSLFYLSLPLPPFSSLNRSPSLPPLSVSLTPSFLAPLLPVPVCL